MTQVGRFTPTLVFDPIEFADSSEGFDGGGRPSVRRQAWPRDRILVLGLPTGPKQVLEGGKLGYVVCAEQRETKGESIPPGVVFIRASPTRTTKAMTGYFLIRNNEVIDAGMDAAGEWITDLCKGIRCDCYREAEEGYKHDGLRRPST